MNAILTCYLNTFHNLQSWSNLEVLPLDVGVLSIQDGCVNTLGDWKLSLWASLDFKIFNFFWQFLLNVQRIQRGLNSLNFVWGVERLTTHRSKQDFFRKLTYVTSFFKIHSLAQTEMGLRNLLLAASSLYSLFSYTFLHYLTYYRAMIAWPYFL